MIRLIQCCEERKQIFILPKAVCQIRMEIVGAARDGWIRIPHRVCCDRECASLRLD